MSVLQSQENKTFLTMMSNVLNTDGFYFCTDYDLTHTLQRLGNTSPDFQDSSLLERVRGTSLGSLADTSSTCSLPFKIKDLFMKRLSHNGVRACVCVRACVRVCVYSMFLLQSDFKHAVLRYLSAVFCCVLVLLMVLKCFVTWLGCRQIRGSFGTPICCESWQHRRR